MGTPITPVEYTNSSPVFNSASPTLGDYLTAVQPSVANGGVARWALGQYREENGVGYRYVQMDTGATAAVAGNLAYHVDGTYKVTATAANTATGLEAGVFISVIAASGFGWIQTWGKTILNNVATAGTGDIVLGDVLVGSASAAGTVTRIEAPATNSAANIQTAMLQAAKIVGKALAAESSSTVLAFLTLH